MQKKKNRVSIEWYPDLLNIIRTFQYFLDGSVESMFLIIYERNKFTDEHEIELENLY